MPSAAPPLPVLARIAQQAAEGDKQAKAALRAVKEHDFSVAVREYAEARGWLVGYMKQTGHVGKDGQWKGMSPRGEPDLRLARAGRAPLFLELKREVGLVRPEQAVWLAALGEYGMLARPRDAAELMEVLA